MSSSHIRDSEVPLSDHDASPTRTTIEEIDAALANVERESVVGAPLLSEGASLDGHITLDPTPRQLREIKIGVTPVGPDVRDYGTVLLQSNDSDNEPVSFFPPRHIAVLQASNLVSGIPGATGWLSDEVAAGRDTVVSATAPSAAGDTGALGQDVHRSERGSRTGLGGVIA